MNNLSEGKLVNQINDPKAAFNLNKSGPQKEMKLTKLLHLGNNSANSSQGSNSTSSNSTKLNLL